MELKQHPLSAAFPSMTEADFLALRDDIEDNGQRDAIVIFEGMVLDGWHRYRSCADLGIEPVVVEFEDSDPVPFVLSRNLHRRHLSASQRAAAVVACSQWAPLGSNQHGKRVGTSSPPSLTSAQMAKVAQVSDKTIKDAKAAHKAGLSEAVKEGAITVKKAAKVARGKPEPAPKKDPEDVAYFGPSAEEIAEAEAAAADDLSLIHKLIEADDRLAAAVAENDKLRAELAVVKLSRDGYMNRSNELISRVKWLKKKLAQVEAAHV